MKIGVWIPTAWSYRFRERLWRSVCLPRCEALGWQVIFYDEGEPDNIYSPRAGDRKNLYNLAAKVRRMCALSYQHNFDWFVRCDTDTELWPERFPFRSPEWTLSHYIGNHCYAPMSDPFPFRYASGMCYILSRTMMKLVADTDDLTVIGKDGREWGEEWAEDRFVGIVAHRHSIPLILEPRIVFNRRYEEKEWLAWHDFGKVVGQRKGCPYVADNEPYGEY